MIKAEAEASITSYSVYFLFLSLLDGKIQALFYFLNNLLLFLKLYYVNFNSFFF